MVFRESQIFCPVLFVWEVVRVSHLVNSSKMIGRTIVARNIYTCLDRDTLWHVTFEWTLRGAHFHQALITLASNTSDAEIEIEDCTTNEPPVTQGSSG